jgi:membrane complex biogenesis BtpA family protein
MTDLFSTDRRTLIGVVHLMALPGAPRFADNFSGVLESARVDAERLAAGGADAIIVENFGDTPFFAGAVGSETVAAMALAVRAVMEAASGIEVGVNVLRNDARSALGICAATGASFLRVNVLCGAAATDQGVITGDAAGLMRERARLAPNVKIFADVHVKHATPIGDTSLVESAVETLERGGADAVILSGSRTGSPPTSDELVSVRERVGDSPILIGSGLDIGNAADLLAHVTGAIVGSSLKEAGVHSPVSTERVAALRAMIDTLS